MKHIKLLKSLIIVAPVLALASPLIILSNTGCGNPTPEPEIRYLPDGTDWVGRTGGTLVYDIDPVNHTYMIANNNDFTADNLVIPDAVIFDDVSYKVIAIGDNAFKSCLGLTGNLVIPNSVTTIGSRAFENSNNISGLSIGNNVTTINEFAFNACTGITGNIVIPNSVTSIGRCAFQNNNNISGLSIGNNVTTIIEFTFNHCYGLTGDLVIPNSVTSIKQAAFQGCFGLNSIVLPNALVGLQDHALGMDLASGYNPDTFKLHSIRFTNVDTVAQITFPDNFFGDSTDVDLESVGVKVYVPNSVRDTYVTKITGISAGQKFSAENIIGYQP